eukprot:10722519-Alexandrium_andersonii.AAC.1
MAPKGTQRSVLRAESTFLQLPALAMHGQVMISPRPSFLEPSGRQNGRGTQKATTPVRPLS